MKHTINILGAFILLLIFAVSCVDDTIDDFIVEKPESIKELEYLNEYDVLKSYIDREANPNFKLGAGVTVSDYLKKGSYFRFINQNFDMMTAGNAMKYASVVGDDGSMNFGSVVQFVEAAREAGIAIYGHTLLWHAQQNNKYLNRIIAPTVIPGAAGDGGYCLVLHNEEAKSDNWGSQTWYQFPEALQQGVNYTFTCIVKGSSEYNESIFLQSSTGGGQLYPGGFAISTEWTEVSMTFSPSHDQIDKFTFNFGDFVGQIYVDNVSLVADGSTENLFPNADFEEGNITGWTGWTPGAFENVSQDGEGYSTGGPGSAGYCLNFTNSTAQANNWGAQVWYQFPEALEQGASYTYTCMVKGTSDYNESIFLQSSTGGSQLYPGGFAITTEWTEVSMTFSPSHDQIDKFTFNFGDFVGTISVDNVVLTKEGSEENLIPNGDFEAANVNGWASWSGYESLSPEGDGYALGGGDQIIEKTPEEKADTLTWAMETWIAGMMEATDGYVKEWDVVNEPISGADTNGDGKYDLWSAANVSENDAKNNFYWGDYLGDDYVRLAVKYAREYGPADIKLFVNDYNLESDWDDNKKLKSLIQWIEQWESDGVTVIDGIGTQMHVSCYMKPETQASKEEHVVKMFELMAATGKLIKITELDMGLVDADGVAVKTPNVTREQYQAMSDYYKFIVEKYFEIIPAAQRAGITHWCPMDSPESSSWRGGEPVGLWSLDTYRKHTYAGFADGLSGK